MTSFLTIMPYVRTILADTQVPYTYSDDIIVSAMKIVILGMDDYSTVAGIFVNPNPSDADTLVIIFKTAKIIKQPSRSFSYRTPVLSVTRDPAQDEGLLAWYDEEIEKWEAGGHMPIAGECAIEAYLEASDRLQEILDEFSS